MNVDTLFKDQNVMSYYEKGIRDCTAIQYTLLIVGVLPLFFFY